MQLSADIEAGPRVSDGVGLCTRINECVGDTHRSAEVAWVLDATRSGDRDGQGHVSLVDRKRVVRACCMLIQHV